jgi:DNA-binding MarR family transcriptional regulator
MDPIKEAFFKIKEDISNLRDEIVKINKKINEVSSKDPFQTTPTNKQTQNQTIQTHNPLLHTYPHTNLKFSIGNEGVPTDRQTNQQTDRHIKKDPISEFKQANEVLNSLDAIKKGIMLKFKSLTPQEMMVFSKLYGLGIQNNETTYKALAKEINLSESSIRDYINKLIKKGVPIEKIRLNNKTILLKISEDLKNVATLDTILKLREL